MDHPRDQICFVCTHVLEGTRSAKLVIRTERDWSVQCGSTHAKSASSYAIVHLGHLIDSDPTLASTLDLEVGWEAERTGLGKSWTRKESGG